MTKPTKLPERLAKTQISLGICPVWSESSLSAWRQFGSLATHWAHSEESDQTRRMLRLIWVLARRTGHFVGFVNLRLIYSCSCLRLYGLYFIGTRLFSPVYHYMSPVKRICVFEHDSVMTNFTCACPAIQRGQGSGFLSEGSSWLTACMSEQRRFWRDCADAISTKFAWRGPYSGTSREQLVVSKHVQQAKLFERQKSWRMATLGLFSIRHVTISMLYQMKTQACYI